QSAAAGVLIAGGRGVESVDGAGAVGSLHRGEGEGRARGENHRPHHEGRDRAGGPALLLLRWRVQRILARLAGPCLGWVARLVRQRLRVLRRLRALVGLNLVRLGLVGLGITGVRLAPLGMLIVLSLACPAPGAVLRPGLAAAGVAVMPEWPKVRRLRVVLSPATAGAIAADTVT